MRVILGGRKTGRTTALIEECAERARAGELCYIVVHSHAAAYEISKRATEKGLTIQFPLTYREFLEREYHGIRIGSFLIDNADMLLQSLTNVPIRIITLEKEPQNED